MSKQFYTVETESTAGVVTFTTYESGKLASIYVEQYRKQPPVIQSPQEARMSCLNAIRESNDK